MRTLRAATIVALLTTGCVGQEAPMPEPVGLRRPALPEITPIRPPDAACIPQLGRRRSGQDPRKIRHVPFRFPRERGKHWFHNSVWYGTVTIGDQGEVISVCALRRFQVDPPWPELDEAIVSAMRQWQYEPVCGDGKSTPFEMRVTVIIDFR